MIRLAGLPRLAVNVTLRTAQFAALGVFTITDSWAPDCVKDAVWGPDELAGMTWPNTTPGEDE